MSELTKKAAAATKAVQDKVSAAVASARTRTGEPKVTKPAKAPKVEAAPEPVLHTPERLDAFITYEKALLDAVAIPDDTGDAMFQAVEAVLYHKERITKAELAKKYLEEA
jgi:hypothetical protein